LSRYFKPIKTTTTIANAAKEISPKGLGTRAAIAINKTRRVAPSPQSRQLIFLIKRD
jgi:hypothetical protein